MLRRAPVFVRRFRDVLWSVAPTRLELPISKPPVQGHRGILHTSRIQYNQDPINILERAHEYTFLVGEQSVELSMQLYLNITDHWRLFAYCNAGMLLSVNLRLHREAGNSFVVGQTLRITGMSANSRSQRSAQLCATLTELGFEVDSRKRLTLGTFDTRVGRFIDTTPQAFVRDFALAALVKGHFMGNKGYRLSGLPAVPSTWTTVERSTAVGRAVPLGLRFEILVKAHGRCSKCGNGIGDGHRLHVDHIRPYSQGGRTEKSNLQALCEKCNLGKGNRALE